MQLEAFLGIISGPIRGHQKQPLALFLGPPEDIGRVSQLTFQAHSGHQESLPADFPGPFKGIGSILRHYFWAHFEGIGSNP